MLLDVAANIVAPAPRAAGASVTPPKPIDPAGPPPRVIATYEVEAGLLNAWLIGLKAKSFQSNEKSARDLGVLEVVNNFTIEEMESKIAQNPSGRLCFEKLEQKGK